MLVLGKPADRIEVDRLLTIGREPGLDVWLNDPGVSRRHASAAPSDRGGIVITDLNSTAGSFVNGHRFDTHELTIGDRLQIGPFCFQFDGHALNRVANAAGGTIRSDHVFFRSGPLTILDDVALTIPASRFVGIIGPSGAGKSSLLTDIAERLARAGDRASSSSMGGTSTPAMSRNRSGSCRRKISSTPNSPWTRRCASAAQSGGGCPASTAAA